jgi:hypothetical protein
MKKHSSVNVTTPLSFCLTSSGISFWQYNLALKKKSQSIITWLGEHVMRTQDSILRLVGWALHRPRGGTFLSCMSPAFPAQLNKIKAFKIMEISDILDVTSCSHTDGYQHFDNKDSSKLLVSFYHITWCHTLKILYLHIHHCKDLQATVRLCWEVKQSILIDPMAT